MITATAEQAPYRTSVRNNTGELLANTVKDGVGGADGFRPHELLEAALAACMNITARIAAEKIGVALEDVSTSVHLKRDGEGPITFECGLSFSGQVTPEQRMKIAVAVAGSPVRRTLSRGVQFAFND